MRRKHPVVRDAEECAMWTYRGSVARHPAYGKTREQIRERLLAVFVDGTPCPICGSPMLRQHILGPHTDAAGQ